MFRSPQPAPRRLQPPQIACQMLKRLDLFIGGVRSKRFSGPDDAFDKIGLKPRPAGRICLPTQLLGAGLERGA